MSRPPLWRALNPTLRQLHARTGDRQPGHCLPWFDSRDAIADRIHYTNQIPTWSEGHSGRLGMNALAHHQVGQGNTCGQHSHSDFTTLWLGALFLKQLKCIESSVVGDDDLRVPHEPHYYATIFVADANRGNARLRWRVPGSGEVFLASPRQRLFTFRRLAWAGFRHRYPRRRFFTHNILTGF